jgi:transcriptional regulator with XRE-family HTH domain
MGRAMVVTQAFGRVLKSVRKDAGLSQRELATRAEIHGSYPSLIERGLRQPTLPVLVGLAKALDTTGSKLVNAACALMRQRRRVP